MNMNESTNIAQLNSASNSTNNTMITKPQYDNTTNSNKSDNNIIKSNPLPLNPTPSLSSTYPKRRKLDPSKVSANPTQEPVRKNKANAKKYYPEVPMSKEDESKWRREARRARNRESARASRAKVQNRLKELEEEVEMWKGKYHELRRKGEEQQSQQQQSVNCTICCGVNSNPQGTTIVTPDVVVSSEFAPSSPSTITACSSNTLTKEDEDINENNIIMDDEFFTNLDSMFDQEEESRAAFQTYFSFEDNFKVDYENLPHISEDLSDEDYFAELLK